MAQPADRSEGVVLVTDYGALDQALAQRDARAAREREIGAKIEEITSNPTRLEE